MREKIFWYQQINILFLYCTKRRCSQIKPQLKVEKENGCSLSVGLYPINVKTAEPIGPKFLVGCTDVITWPQGRFMNDKNLKKMCFEGF